MSDENVSAEQVESAIEEHASAFEADRYRRAKELAAERDRKNRRLWKALAFLYALMVLAFVVLAYRTEVNNNQNKENGHQIEQGLYTACLARQAAAISFNRGRETLIQLVLTNPARTPESKALAAQQLRDGLLLPIEDCGADPGY